MKALTLFGRLINKNSSRMLVATPLLLMLLSLVSGCSTLHPPAIPANAPVLPTPAEIMAAKMSVMRAIKKESLPPLSTLKPTVAVEQKMPYEGKLFSVVARSTPVRDVLLGLAKEAEINLIIEKGVDPSEEISVEMHDLPLITILDTVLDAYEFFYVLQDNILRIKAMETRIFHFDYPLMGNAATSSVGGDLLGSGGGSGGSSGGGSSGGSGGSSGGADLSGEFTVSAEVDKDDLDVWDQVEKTIKGDDTGAAGADDEPTGLMSSKGQMQMSKMSGTIVVTDRRSNLNTIAKYLEIVQSSLGRQVILEAKILEVALNHDHQYGINWQNLNLGNLIGGGVVSVAADFSQNNSGGLNLTYLDNSGPDTLTSTINALSTQGNVNVLSSPRINVINNQTALINVGRTLPFLNWELTSTVNGDLVSSSLVPTVKTAQAGISLGVTPQISADGVTTLHVVPVITSLASSKSFTFDGTTWDVPIFDVRQTDTFVKVQDGKTIILGGLIQNKLSDDRSKIPMLGDIPLLGNALFSGDVVASEKLELVILLTPTIVEK